MCVSARSSFSYSVLPLSVATLRPHAVVVPDTRSFFLSRSLSADKVLKDTVCYSAALDGSWKTNLANDASLDFQGWER
jgi:hypothetical protein